MKKISNFATTGTKDWKKQCLEWVKTNQAFRVYGIEKKHLAFCADLCLLQNHTFTFDNDSTVTFTPENSD
ncbi:MAG TPA: hypothetical protein VE344_04340 [Methylomirabilota bacterium]|nr:hypothetical protein [Methylomirabilota bacterium]